MIILCDLNQVLFAAVLSETMGVKKNQPLSEKYLRHIILNMVRSYSKQFRQKYGEMILCCDSTSWRKQAFPFYKAHRKKNRDASDINWPEIFTQLNKIRDELREHLPYRVLSVDGAEADDIIALLAARYSPSEEVLILSSDKDFLQLQKYKNVQQYSPIKKMFILTADPTHYIKEHILRGDSGDGIPNFLSHDSVFVSGDRQKSISKQKMAGWLVSDPEVFCENDIMKRGYARNKMLIDLDCTPDPIKNAIVEAHANSTRNPKSKILNYLIQHQMKELVAVIDEF